MFFAKILSEMMEVEGQLEKKRRELGLRSDFNLVDAFKLFNSSKNHAQGPDCDDFFHILTKVLGLEISKDEMFIIFYKIDRDGDGHLNFNELQQAFLPFQYEYRVLLQQRKAFYGSAT